MRWTPHSPTPALPRVAGRGEKVSHRHYSTGFWFGQPGQFTEDARYIRDYQVCAVVESCSPDGKALCSLRNKFRAGDTLELIGPGLEPFSFQVPPMTDADGFPLEEPRTPQMKFTLPIPKAVPPLSLLRKQVTQA